MNLGQIGSTPNLLPTAPAAPAAAPAASAAPAAASAPGDQVTLNGTEKPAAKQPQWKVDGPVDPLPQPLPPKKWTVLLWSCSDNNLYSFMQDDIDEAERVGGTDNMNIIVQTDHAQVGGGAKRYELQADSQPQLHSPVRADLGDCNMADPKQLSDFIKWGIKNYPSDNVMLIMSDHGKDWGGACHDEHSNGWMTPQIIQSALQDAREATGKKIDVLGFDACLMANAEALHQLKDECNFYVGSEETEGGAGWQYDQTVTRKSNRIFSSEMLQGAETAMRSRVDFSPKEFAAHIVDMAKGHQGDLATMSAFDTSKVQGITDAAKSFGEALVSSNISTAELKLAKRKTQGFYETKDLADFATQISTLPSANDKVKDAAKNLQDAINNALIAEQHSTRYPGAHGLQVELNKTSKDAPMVAPPNMESSKAERLSFGSYGDLDFAKQTNWAAVQDKINAKDASVAATDTPAPGPSVGGLSPQNIEALIGALLGGAQPQQ